MTVVPNAYILEKTARLSGLSAGQLREWAKSGFFQPHFESGLYSLRDIISLRTLGILRNERGISLQSLKKFKKWLDQRYDQPWSELRFATYGSEVLLDADGRLISGKKPGQYADVVPFPVERVELTVRKAAAKEAARSVDQVGQVSKQPSDGQRHVHRWHANPHVHHLGVPRSGLLRAEDSRRVPTTHRG
jgi:DNA-binding transcriptional MerR regulator